jgi:hypothetical protein
VSLFDAAEQLALGVVKPGGNALFLSEDNSTVDYWVPVDKAAQSGMPFLAELKDDLAASDLDSDELVAGGEAVEDWAVSEGLPVVVVTSGRAGHRHLYVR